MRQAVLRLMPSNLPKARTQDKVDDLVIKEETFVETTQVQGTIANHPFATPETTAIQARRQGHVLRKLCPFKSSSQENVRI
jgi:hypothetical protein